MKFFIKKPIQQLFKAKSLISSLIPKNLRQLKTKMPKRSVEETNNESLNSEFKYDDSDNQLRKKN